MGRGNLTLHERQTPVHSEHSFEHSQLLHVQTYQFLFIKGALRFGGIIQSKKKALRQVDSLPLKSTTRTRNEPKPSQNITLNNIKGSLSTTSKVTFNNIESAPNQAQTEPKTPIKTKNNPKKPTVSNRSNTKNFFPHTY